jgi:predicted nicotinamide N-methyase
LTTRAFRTKVVEVAVRGQAFRLTAVHDPAELLDGLTEEEFRKAEERIPYWGELWPGALGIAQTILDGPPLHGKRCLEIGCGLGLAGIAAARHGARVHLTDAEPASVEFALENARANDVAVTGGLLDWRAPEGGPYDLSLGADLLYERRNLEPIAALLDRLLAPGGRALLTDPRRTPARDFPLVLGERGLRVEVSTLDPGGGLPLLHLYEVRR